MGEIEGAGIDVINDGLMYKYLNFVEATSYNKRIIKTKRRKSIALSNWYRDNLKFIILVITIYKFKVNYSIR